MSASPPHSGIFDASALPLCIICPGHDETEGLAELRIVHAHLDEHLAGGGVFAIVAFVPKGSAITLALRGEISRFRNVHQRIMKEREIAVAVIAESAMARGALQAISWISSDVPLRYFHGLAEAESWVKGVLAQNDVTWTPSMAAAILRLEREMPNDQTTG